MDDPQFNNPQRGFEIESAENGQPLSDKDFEDLFETGRVDSLLMLRQTMRQTRMAMSLADATSDDHELVYVNEAFCRLTGYEPHDVVGQNCRILQGPRTDLQTVQDIRSSLTRGRTGVFEILNYRKDGSAFWNALHVGPVYDAKGNLRYYFGSQWDISEARSSRARERLMELTQRELNHRSMNIFSVISSLITLSANGADSAKVAMARARARVGALADAHRASLLPGNADNDVQLAPLMERLLAPYTEQVAANLVVTGRDIAVRPEALTVIGMAVHELATNSMKYGFLGGHAAAGSLDWQVSHLDDGSRTLCMLWEEVFEDGAPSSEDISDGTGSRILRALLQPNGGLIERASEGKAFTVRLVIPLDGEAM